MLRQLFLLCGALKYGMMKTPKLPCDEVFRRQKGKREKTGGKEKKEMKESKKREHVWIRKMFMLMAAFVLILCMKTTTYAASTKTVNMESVGSGMYIHIGTMKRGKGTVYHRVKVKKKGILIVAGAAIAEDGTPYGMAVRLCDSKKRSLEPYKRSYVSTEEFIVYGVDPGTYYIEVKNQSYYSLSAGVKKVKDFGGDSKKTAYQIAHKKRVSGLVTAGEKAGSADWFKFKLAKNRKVKIELAAIGTDAFRFYLYGPGCRNGICMASLKNDAKDFQKKVALKKGTYYIKVVRASKKSNASGFYDVRWSMQ